METKYHIDVTSEEDSLFRDIVEPQTQIKEKNTFIKNMLTNKIFWSVVGVHLVIVSVLATAAPDNKTSMTGVIEEDQKFVEEKINDPKVVAKEIVDTLSQGGPLPTPTPYQKITQPAIKHTLVKEYVIKNGDTLFSVAKKYKLNYHRLIKINNIKDPNKITVGQKLKFM